MYAESSFLRYQHRISIAKHLGEALANEMPMKLGKVSINRKARSMFILPQ